MQVEDDCTCTGLLHFFHGVLKVDYTCNDRQPFQSLNLSWNTRRQTLHIQRRQTIKSSHGSTQSTRGQTTQRSDKSSCVCVCAWEGEIWCCTLGNDPSTTKYIGHPCRLYSNNCTLVPSGCNIVLMITTNIADM